MIGSVMNPLNGSPNTSNIVNWVEQLKSEDVKRRVFAVSHLKEISQCFGVQKTKEKILPFLLGNINKSLKTMKKK